jgi:hypothetical protein
MLLLQPVDGMPPIGCAAGEVDWRSGCTNDPGNAGENNQTGSPETARYVTCLWPEVSFLCPQSPYTMDLSNVQLGIPEPHKEWVCDDAGLWDHFAGCQVLDDGRWIDADYIGRLHSWRADMLARYGWPQPREQWRLSSVRLNDLKVGILLVRLFAFEHTWEKRIPWTTTLGEIVAMCAEPSSSGFTPID